MMISLVDLPEPLPVPEEEARKKPKWRDVAWYQPSPELVGALDLAVELGQPLLITGPPGSGKTSAAYWAAWRLGVAAKDFFHIQVRSDATAQGLKYEFDAVRYFREAQITAARARFGAGGSMPPLPAADQRKPFVEQGPLWTAFEASTERQVALLFDEIDKAPRDFPNDLLDEFDTTTFEVPDLPQADNKPKVVTGKTGRGHLALIVLTSNGEQNLPDAFLRRCLYHHVSLDAEAMRKALRAHLQGKGIPLDVKLVGTAVERFQELLDVPGLIHRPGLAELLVWLKAIATSPEAIAALKRRESLAKLMFLGALLKHSEDLDLVRGAE